MKKLTLTLFLALIFTQNTGRTQGFDDFVKTSIEKEGITLNIVTESGAVTKTDNGYEYSGAAIFFEALKDGKKVKVKIIETDCDLYRRYGGRLRYTIGYAPQCTSVTIIVKNSSTTEGNTSFTFILTDIINE